MSKYIAILLIPPLMPVTNLLLLCEDFAFSPKIIVLNIHARKHAKVERWKSLPDSFFRDHGSVGSFPVFSTMH